MLFVAFSKRKRHDLTIGVRGFKQISVSETLASLILVFAALAITCQVVGVGPKNIWLRHVYLIYDNLLIKRAGGPMVLMAIPVLGLLSGQVSISTGLKRFANMFFLLIVILLAALSTRAFAAAPILFFVGRYLANPSDSRAMKRIICSAVVAPFFVVFPLLSRQAPNQGVEALPENLINTVGLGDQDHSILSSGYYHVVLNTIFISVPETQATFESGATDNWAYLRTAINPLPGFATDFAETMVMLNPVTPMTAIGDLLRCGVWAAMMYFVVVGIIFANLEANLRGGHGPGLVRLGQVGLALMFVVVSVQYPLRNATRFLYYILLVEIGLWVFTITKLKPRYPESSRRATYR
jgi:hypothetical protein